MNLTHRGKIGRLPLAIQEQVNRRLHQGDRGAPVVAWLNSLPEVRAVLAAEFNGKPVRQQNLSDWRKHGYKQWLWRQEAQTVAAETENLTVGAAAPLLDQMTSWASVRYLMAMQQAIDQEGVGKPTFKLLRAFCRDVVALQRGDVSRERIKFEQQRLESKTPAVAALWRAQPTNQNI